MKNIKLITSSVFIILLLSAVYSLYAAEVKGKTVSLSAVVTGANADLTKEQAVEYVKSGKPLAFKTSKGEIYLVFNTDGSLADKNLALNAGTEYTITGKVHNKKGLKYIIADKFN